jgi:hypothetical protein
MRGRSLKIEDEPTGPKPKLWYHYIPHHVLGPGQVHLIKTATPTLYILSHADFACDGAIMAAVAHNAPARFVSSEPSEL